MSHQRYHAVGESGGWDGLSGNPRVIGPSAQLVRIAPSGAGPVIGPALRVIVRPGPIRVEPVREREIAPIKPPVITAAPARAIPVEAAPRAAWDDRGWHLEHAGGEHIYTGFYQVKNRRTGERRQFEGRITQRGQTAVPYIADPPIEIKRHPKAPCFSVTQAPWFQIHWRRPAANADDALLYVERVLDEAINGRS